MSLKRQFAFSILSSSPAAALWRSTRSGALRILAYHRVLDDDLRSFPFDEDVVSATSESFWRQMRFVKENFDVITFRDLHSLEESGRPWPKRPLIVTFDDGYIDNYAVAYPILKDAGVSATIFLAAAHMDSGELFWWDKISYCIKHAANDTLEYAPFSATHLSIKTPSERSVAIARLLQWVKSVPEDVKATFVAKLPELVNCAPQPKNNRMHLSWDETREMAKYGIEFGSHTMSHPVLPNIKSSDLEAEIAGSKRRIEAELDMLVLTFSYPVGRFNAAVEAVVRGAGYRFAVSYDEGVAEVPFANQFRLPRIHVEPGVTFEHFRSVLMFPGIVLR